MYPDVNEVLIFLDFIFNPINGVREEDATLLAVLIHDLQEDFRYAVKRMFLRYLLKSDDEKKRLQLELEPPEFPLLTIRAPVPWKSCIQLAMNRLDQMLMVNHPLIQGLHLLWEQLYDDFIIFDTKKCYQGQIPLHFDFMTELIHKHCLIARDVSLIQFNNVINPINRKMHRF